MYHLFMNMYIAKKKITYLRSVTQMGLQRHFVSCSLLNVFLHFVAMVYSCYTALGGSNCVCLMTVFKQMEVG